MTINNRANRLINADSPYLRQHAYNPVDWYPWSEEALKLAEETDKPILVSIGYSACHWCHVMEHESFENEQIAQVMNEHFVCIKIDREERPDLDQIYMDAVQHMGLGGGWPLNVFLTPQKLPFYGGTYFPPQRWDQLLKQVATTYRVKKAEIINSAEELTANLATSEIKRYGLSTVSSIEVNIDFIKRIYQQLKRKFDYQLGGTDKEPKFPMPSIWSFVLKYYYFTKDEDAKRILDRTLQKMASGGLYDPVGGGFARYSTDSAWFIPHFEKMLYDNGQLLSVYANAYRLFPQDQYIEVIEQTIAWLQREMQAPEGYFYAALDADSEGIEGKYYIWTYDELQTILSDKKEFELFTSFYDVKPGGNWEHDYNILYRSRTEENFCIAHQLNLATWQTIRKNILNRLLAIRNQRIAPGLDDKILLSWNAMAIKGIIDAYFATNNMSYLQLAIKAAEAIWEDFRTETHYWHASKNRKGYQTAFAEDYACWIDTLISLHQATFDNKWLKEAEKLTHYMLNAFFDAEENMFYFTKADEVDVIVRKKELFDNVIPSSNATMAINLYRLGTFNYNQEWIDLALKMRNTVLSIMSTEPSYLTQWAILSTMTSVPFVEVCITGKQAKEYAHKLLIDLPNPQLLVVASEEDADFPAIIKGKYTNDTLSFYICSNRTCLPAIHNYDTCLATLNSATIE